MKRLVSWLMSGVLLASLLFGLVMAPTAQAADLSNVADEKIAERGDKIDLNNCSVRRFQAFPGMYPTLAGKIVLGGPYNTVDDLFNLDLTDRQKELVEKYKSNFTVTPASIALNEGFDRINDAAESQRWSDPSGLNSLTGSSRRALPAAFLLPFTPRAPWFSCPPTGM